jgi:hypothetical protein
LNQNSNGPRDAMMRALSVAEEIAASVPTMRAGDDMSVTGDRVSVMLHRRPDDVARLAADRSWPVKVAKPFDGKQRVWTDGVVQGVAVQVWALGAPVDMARYRDVAAPAGLPAAWSAAAVSA